MLASRKNHVKVVKLLVDLGADQSLSDKVSRFLVSIYYLVSTDNLHCSTGRKHCADYGYYEKSRGSGGSVSFPRGGTELAGHGEIPSALCKGINLVPSCALPYLERKIGADVGIISRSRGSGEAAGNCRS